MKDRPQLKHRKYGYLLYGKLNRGDRYLAYSTWYFSGAQIPKVKGSVNLIRQPRPSSIPARTPPAPAATLIGLLSASNRGGDYVSYEMDVLWTAVAGFEIKNETENNLNKFFAYSCSAKAYFDIADMNLMWCGAHRGFWIGDASGWLLQNTACNHRTFNWTY